jgi:hypothetical protein
MIARFFFIGIALCIMGFIIYLLRSRKLREKYAALWLAVGLVGLVLAIFPAVLEGTANLFGVAVPSNLLFVIAILLLLGVCLHLSLEISRMEDETRVLAEHIAILDALAVRAGWIVPVKDSDDDVKRGPGDDE